VRAVVIEAPGRVAVTDVDPAAPGRGEVAVAVERVGICATDVHILHGGFPTATYPLTPGHEVAGRISKLGSDVEGLAVGDPVVIDPGLPCLRCRLCREGRLNLCEHRQAIGVTRTGGAAESVIVPAGNCHRVLAGTPDGAAVLAEPLACVVHALDLVRSPQGQDVLIYGAGAIGVLAAMVARAWGAASVSFVELADGRRQRAGTLGRSAASADGLGGADWGLVIDATGAVPAIRDGLGRLRRGGTFLQIGVAAPDAVVEVRPYDLFQRELTMVGSLTTRYSFPRALSLLREGAIDASLLLDAPLALDRYAEAIDSSGHSETLKVTVAP